MDSKRHLSRGSLDRICDNILALAQQTIWLSDKPPSSYNGPESVQTKHGAATSVNLHWEGDSTPLHIDIEFSLLSDTEKPL